MSGTKVGMSEPVACGGEPSCGSLYPRAPGQPFVGVDGECSACGAPATGPRGLIREAAGSLRVELGMDALHDELDVQHDQADPALILELDGETVKFLTVLCSEDYPTVKDVIEHLAHSAADGVRRPGAWERRWTCQAFSDEFTKKLEADPNAYFFDRPIGAAVRS